MGTRILLNDFEYFEPETISDAITILAKYRKDAKLIAGGTDLLVDMKKGKIKPKYLVNLMKILDLRYITKDKRGLRIGATTTFREITASKLIKREYPLLFEAAEAMGTVQIRNMATIGGNICNAIPSAEIPPALVALDAVAKIAGRRGERSLPLEEFLMGIGKIALKSGELLTEVYARSPPPRSGTAFLKLSRTTADLATLNVAVRVTLEKNGACKEARVVVGGGVGPTLIRSKKAEALLKGKVLKEPLIEKAAQAASAQLKPRPTSIRASPLYKIEVCKVLVKRALLKALERTKAGGAR
ncbi:MAG: xanthine dehydrogenase family protein subunit M [Candidatus Hodarchaeaceae archaeon]|nr:xanthine dehydrogenase family protein subunit M [Candidatus Hodarchaeaceae archaeon]